MTETPNMRKMFGVICFIVKFLSYSFITRVTKKYTMNWIYKTSKHFLPTLLTLALTVTSLFLAGPLPALAQQKEEPEMEQTIRRGPDEGGGPYDRLVIRGAMMIDGTGAPPRGPMTIVVEGDEITEIKETDPDAQLEGAGRVIDAEGMYVTPGFIDVHTHTGRKKIGYQASYVYKLWMGHGITTAKGVPFGPMDWSLKQEKLSAKNEIVAPRMVVCQDVGDGKAWEDRDVNTPEQAREWVRYANEKGVDCVAEIGAHDPEIMAAVLSTADSLGLQTEAHLDQMGVARMDARDAAELGLDELTHYYGLFEALLNESTIQDWPIDYNYNNEYDRFGQVARLWDQIHPPGSKEWDALVQTFLDQDLYISPTMSIYLAGRNVMSARNAVWHEEYTLPQQQAFFEPSPDSHGSYFWNWTTADEVAWEHFYDRWMKFLDDYNDAGGRLLVGSDSGFIYQLYGFGYIQELELLQEAGLHPIEVIRSATLYGAQSIFETHESDGESIKYGAIREGLKADLLVMRRNPLKDFKTLYGTGAVRRNEETGEPERVRSLKYTIKDGIVYDSQKLLEDVRQMVDKAEKEKTASTTDNRE
ncbi:MAG: amidohydrolase family protein [Salinibacter sp.]